MMNKNDWILGVLGDIVAHAGEHGMPKTYDALLNAMLVVSKEVHSKAPMSDSYFDPTGDIVPFRRQYRN